jgi:hypothetical protein
MTAEAKLIKTQAGVWYSVYVNDDSNLCWVKSSDGGFTWSDPFILQQGLEIEEISLNLSNDDKIVLSYTTKDDLLFIRHNIEPISNVGDHSQTWMLG